MTRTIVSIVDMHDQQISPHVTNPNTHLRIGNEEKSDLETPVAGPGRTQMPGNTSGLSKTRAIEPRYRPPVQRGILGG